MNPPAARVSERRAGLAAVAGFAGLAVYFTGLFPPFANPNELSRLETVYAFVEDGTFRIDHAVAVLGDHEDKAFSGGHFYSNKAPGLALAAIPVYRILRVFFPAPRSGGGVPLFFFLRLLTVSLVCVVALARLSRSLDDASHRGGALVLLAIVFGTSFLYYGRSFFGHAWSGSLLFLAWDCLRGAEKQNAGRRVGIITVASGFLASWALISEYTVAPIVLLLLLRSGARRAWRRLALFSAGAGVPLLLLLIYQAVCFGSPFTPSYAREAYPAYAQLAHQRFFGFGLPNPGTLSKLLFHPARGVLLFSPFFLWTVVGLIRWWRSRDDRPDCLFVLGAVIALPLLLSAYPNWHGGWSLGSRYLVPVFLLAGLAVVRGLETPLSRGIFLAAATFSVANHLLLTLTWPNFPVDVPWPAATGSLWFLGHGWVAPHIGPASGIGDSLAVALTIAAAAAGILMVVRVADPIVPRPVPAIALGLIPLLLLLARPPQLPFEARLWRAAVFGRFSGFDPACDELRRVVLSAQTPEEHRQALRTWRSYGPPDPLGTTLEKR